MNILINPLWLALWIVAAGAASGANPAAPSTPGTGTERTTTAKGIPIEIRNLSDRDLTRVPATFGQLFPRGAVPRGQQVRCALDDGSVQVDPKRHYDDGSLRFAVISVVLPQLPARDATRLQLVSGPARPASARAPITAAELLKTLFEAELVLRFPDGKSKSVSARQLLDRAGAQSATWLRGPIATEWLLAGAPRDEASQPDEDLRVQFQVRAYAGCQQGRVSVVVENCLDHWAGNVRYQALIKVGGKPVFEETVDHRPLSRWRKVFWWGADEPPLHAAHDLATFSAAGALPNYDRELTLPNPSGELLKHLARTGSDWQPMGKGSLTAYMPTTGGRPEIAPYPTWTVQYLLTMDPSRKALVLANGDLAGSWPIHVRAAKTSRIMTIAERPRFWLDERGQDRPRWQPARHPPDPKQVKLVPDLAHQSSLAYVPYLVTGDFYFLEEAYFWANYCLLATWPSPRGNERGLIADQIRGDAWALRNIADAAWIAPDTDAEKDYFEEKTRNNLAFRTQKMCGPPEHNQIGAWGERTVADARIQNPANPNWLLTAPWEADYLLWSLHHLVELGHAEAARPRDFLLRLRVGLLTHAPDFDPMLGTPYRLVVGERARGGPATFYYDWKKLGDENAQLSKPDLPNYGNSYAYSARAAVVCGMDGGFPKSRDALKWLEDHLPNHRRVMAENPAWAIVPRSDRPLPNSTPDSADGTRSGPGQ